MRANQLIVRTHDETTLFREFCRVAVELGGFCLAWIGVIDPTTERVEQRAVFSAEVVDDSAIAQAIGHVYRDRGSAATAVRLGRTIYTNDVRRAPDDSPWRVDDVPGQFIGGAAFPLDRGGKAQIDFTPRCAPDFS
jgi:GAF domain-containing protein